MAGSICQMINSFTGAPYPLPIGPLGSTGVLVSGMPLGGDHPPGFQTPSRAYGADFALELPGVTRTDEPE